MSPQAEDLITRNLIESLDRLQQLGHRRRRTRCQTTPDAVPFPPQSFDDELKDARAEIPPSFTPSTSLPPTPSR